ncbi:unnamed protein product, partial [Darwinula stevensoni]
GPAKEGSGSGSGGSPMKGEESMTEERIAQILNQATAAMKESSNASTATSTASAHGGNPSPSNRSSPSAAHSPPVPRSDARKAMLGRSSSVARYENDDISQEAVARIYQEQLAQLAAAVRSTPTPNADSGDELANSLAHREHYSNLLASCFSQGLFMNRSPEEIGMALSIYQQELSKLTATAHAQARELAEAQARAHPGVHPSAQAGSGSLDLSVKRESAAVNGGSDESNDDDRDEPPEKPSSAFSLVTPKSEPGVSPPHLTSATTATSLSTSMASSLTPPSQSHLFPGSSPLQRMAHITNALISQPSLPSAISLPSQRPLKAILPPITQQQFDQYQNLNTEDIVKKIKEQLSQYSISQRLFGESVLGLSQGSVSDLLARPKPWHMLTQKGREPFIRMKIFLEDDNAVHKLVASQYKIAPEKLMRTSSSYGTPHTHTPHVPIINHESLECPTAMALSRSGSKTGYPESLLSKAIDYGMGQRGLPAAPVSTPHPLDALKKNAAGGGGGGGGLSPKGGILPPQHNVYEMAALTQDLDTQLITTKIKETLLANNIGQKIFGEAVLGLSQGSVSELLSKPKPWHMLSIKGREPFIRMQLWLSDPNNIEKLQTLKNERREANKRRRSAPVPDPPTPSGADVSSDSADVYAFGTPSPTSPAKKQRVLFSDEQKEALRLAFQLDPYPSVATMEFLAQELGLTSRTITNWFHNHRMRLKQQAPHDDRGGNGLPSAPREGPQSFDPMQFRFLLQQRLLELHKERVASGSSPLSMIPPPFPHPGSYPFFNPLIAGLGGLDLRLVPPTSDSGDAAPLNLKRDPDSELSEDSDAGSNGDSNGSGSSAAKETTRKEPDKTAPSRSSRRKPAAPQWVNPDWQHQDKDVIINGVCVMQTDAIRADQAENGAPRTSPKPVNANNEGSDSNDEVPEEEEEEDDEEEEDEMEDSSAHRSPPVWKSKLDHSDQ